MRESKPKTPAEERTLAFDFADDLPDGATISSVVSVTAAVYRGTDPNPAAILSGAPAIVGTDVLQRMVGGIAGVDYLVSALVTFSDTQVAELMGVLPVRATI